MSYVLKTISDPLMLDFLNQNHVFLINENTGNIGKIIQQFKLLVFIGY